jgi:ribonuclease HII
VKTPPATARRPSLSMERALRSAGHACVAGLDEVGRGAWAGPLTIGVAVVRPRAERSMPPWLRDSKQLSEAKREEIFEAVGAWCVEWSVGHATPQECDEWGMTKAWRVAAERALAGLDSCPDAVLLDGPTNLLRRPLHEGGGFGGHVRPVVKGDARCASVAAASVLAKVVRDRLMRAESEHYPAYSFERNKGYPSPSHQMALQGYGLSAVHRRWAYIDDLAYNDWQPRRLRRPDDPATPDLPARLFDPDNPDDQGLDPSEATSPE